MLRRSIRRLGTTNRYTDGSGRVLDGSNIPRELYLEPISDKKYPVRGEHWQPVVAGVPSQYKGHIVVAGGGITGCSAACMFALRGWHVTVFEKGPRPSLEDKVAGLPVALLTKRAVDTLHVAGVRVPELKGMGRKVVGVMERPGNLATALTKGITERHDFPVNMLTCELNQLRYLFARHIEALPSDNARIFYNHTLAAVFPDRKTAVLKPLREHERDTTAFDTPLSWETYEKVKEMSDSKELTTETVKWEDNVEGVEYDLMLACDGANSKIRNMLKLGTHYYPHWGVMWFSVKNSELKNDYIHQWIHEFPEHDLDGWGNTNIGFVRALPRLEPKTFSVMLYMPIPVLESKTVEQLREMYCPDLSGDTDVVSSHIKNHPTVFSKDLFNSKAFPNIVLMGDAAHACNPFFDGQSLGLSLEDAAYCVNQIDARGRNMWDSVRQYSRERGVAGDSLRVITERSMYYAIKKQSNPLLRFRNLWYHGMHYFFPREINGFMSGSNNYVYPRSMSVMLNGRGYTSFELAEWQQSRANRWWCFGRLYT